MSITHSTQSEVVRSLLMAIEDLQQDPHNRNNEVGIEMALREIEADLEGCVDAQEYEDTLGELGELRDESSDLEEEVNTLTVSLTQARNALESIAKTMKMDDPPGAANENPYDISDYVAECVSDE